MEYQCEQINEMLTAYIDGMLNDEEKKHVEEHLSSCESCKAEYEQIIALVKELNSLPEVPVPTGVVFTLQNLLEGTWDQRPVKPEAVITPTDDKKVIDLEEKRQEKEQLERKSKEAASVKNGLFDEDVRETEKLFQQGSQLSEKASDQKTKNKVWKRITAAAAAVVICLAGYGVYQNISDDSLKGDDILMNMQYDTSSPEVSEDTLNGEDADGTTPATDMESSNSNNSVDGNSQSPKSNENESATKKDSKDTTYKSQPATSGDNTTSNSQKDTSQRKSVAEPPASEPVEIDGGIGLSESQQQTSDEGVLKSSMPANSDNSLTGEAAPEAEIMDAAPLAPADLSEPEAADSGAQAASGGASSSDGYEDILSTYGPMIAKGLKNVNYEIVGFERSTNTLTLIIIDDKKGNSINKTLKVIAANGVIQPAAGYEDLVKKYWNYS